MTALRTVTAVRYVTPLREGGSLPAIIEADDSQLYVTKFRGAGQGPAVLVAEVIVGELGRSLGLPVPELVVVDLGEALARAEPDPEIQALLTGSVGANLGLSYLAGALAFDAAAPRGLEGELASQIVAFDAFVMNVDRTARNTNLLVVGGKLWLIDHGAALYFHHDWDGGTKGSDRPFTAIRDHVLLPLAAALETAGPTLLQKVDDAAIDRACQQVPDAWLTAQSDTPLAGPDAHRAAYAAYLRARRDAAPIFLEEARRARVARL